MGRLKVIGVIFLFAAFFFVSNIDFKEKMANEKEQTNKTSKYDAKAQVLRACEKIAGN